MAKINGKVFHLREPLPLKKVLLSHGYNPELVAIEIDQNLVKRKDFSSFLVDDSMYIEVFTFVGGG